MKLLTLNCHSWQEKNQLDKIKYLARTIAEKDYDVIALQEVSQLIDTKIIYNNVREDNFGDILKNEIKALGKEYHLMWDFSHIGYDIYEEGLAILTKLPMVSTEAFYITKSTSIDNWKSRKIISATIKYGSEYIDIYSCHIGWWNDEDESFKLQVDNLVKKIKDDRLSLIMGDFNNSATIRDEGYDYIINRGLYDTYELAQEKDRGTTVLGEIAGWEGNDGGLRLDLVLTNRKTEVYGSRVIFNGENKDIISDHYGVEVIMA